MTYNIYAEKSIHDSESKFYQIIRISSGRRMVLVTHWGKYSDGILDLVPRTHGQRKIEMHDSGGLSAYNSVRRNKSKRGYSTWECTVNRSFGPEFLQASLEKLFKADDVAAIMAYITVSEEPSKPAKEDVANPFYEEILEDEGVESVSVPTFESATTHEEWASW